MKLKHVITIILFGSIWGFFEATLGGIMHLAKVPFTGTIMSAIGFSLLYLALKSGVKPSGLFIVSLVAASFKFMDSWLFALPLFDRHIINPATAIACQGLAAAFFLGRNAVTCKIPALFPRFIGAEATSMIAFNIISVGIYGWHTFHTKAPVTAAFVKLPITAALATAFSFFVPAILKRISKASSPAWQGIAAALLAVLAVLARVNI